MAIAAIGHATQLLPVQALTQYSYKGTLSPPEQRTNGPTLQSREADCSMYASCWHSPLRLYPWENPPSFGTASGGFPHGRSPGVLPTASCTPSHGADLSRTS